MKNQKPIESYFEKKDTEKFFKRLIKKICSAWKLTPAELKQLGGK
ncbi:MAG: hypothetical protein WDL87_01965 [Candidatus Omnitrophota bacterium]